MLERNRKYMRKRSVVTIAFVATLVFGGTATVATAESNSTAATTASCAAGHTVLMKTKYFPYDNIVRCR